MVVGSAGNRIGLEGNRKGLALSSCAGVLLRKKTKKDGRNAKKRQEGIGVCRKYLKDFYQKHRKHIP